MNKKLCILLIVITILALGLIPVFSQVTDSGMSPVAERILGIKTFVNGLVIKDPNTASIDPNGGARVKYLGINQAYNPNYQIKANGFTVDPNGGINTTNIGLGEAVNPSYSLICNSIFARNDIWSQSGTMRPYQLNVNNGKFTVDPNGATIAGADTDIINVFGRAKIGYNTYADIFFLSHYDRFSVTDYAFGQSAVGVTYVNAPLGQNILLRNNNATVVTVDTNGLTIAADKIIVQDGLTTVKKSISLADDATVTMPTITTGGMLKVWTAAQYAEYFVKSDGTIEYIRLSLSADDADSDGITICVYDGGTNAILKNRSGGTLTFGYILEYN